MCNCEIISKMLNGVIILHICLLSLSESRLCPDPLCPPDDNQTVLLPSADCREFFYCQFGLPALLKCPPGLRFNQTVPGCVPEDMADCTSCEEPAPQSENEWNDNGEQTKEFDLNDYLPFINF